MGLNSDAPIIINSKVDIQGDGVEDGIVRFVALAPNDDFAIETTMTLRPMDSAVRCVLGGTDVTPRVVNGGLPRSQDSNDPQETSIRPNAPVLHTLPLNLTTKLVPHPLATTTITITTNLDVPSAMKTLSVVQLFTYLSKYPHVRHQP